MKHQRAKEHALLYFYNQTWDQPAMQKKKKTYSQPPL
jgi:hypothetical protein